MMMFDDVGFCSDLDTLCGSLGKGDIAARQTEPDAVVEDDYSDEEIDVDELERRMWRDKMRFKRLKEQNKAKEGIDAAKQRQSQEQARRKNVRGMPREARARGLTKRMFMSNKHK